MTPEVLRKKLLSKGQFKEIWLEHASGSKLCALINGDTGWLLYLKNKDDIGFSTRNNKEESDEGIDYLLGNGQLDSYPKKWALPLNVLKGAMIEFIGNGKLPHNIEWNDDSK